MDEMSLFWIFWPAFSWWQVRKEFSIARETKSKKPTKVTKIHISFFNIEIEIETLIKSNFYYLADTWGKSWEWAGDLTQKLWKYVRTGCTEIYKMVLIGYKKKIETWLIAQMTSFEFFLYVVLFSCVLKKSAIH